MGFGEKPCSVIQGEFSAIPLMAFLLEDFAQSSFPHFFIYRVEIHNPPPSWCTDVKDLHPRTGSLGFLGSRELGKPTGRP